MNKSKIKIATIYTETKLDRFLAQSMDMIRWLRISEALSGLGYSVDMIVNIKEEKTRRINERLRQVPYREFDWRNYDVIKTFFNEGFKSLERHGGSRHPFIISKTTVVGAGKNPGVYFFGITRWRLFRVLRRINAHAKYITVLSEPNLRLWEKEFGKKGNVLLVPTGTDKVVPRPSRNPYKAFEEKIAIYAGNICGKQQRETNLVLQNRLNRIGFFLRKEGIRLCLVGTGLVDKLDPRYVTYLGSVDHDDIWDYQYFADCGIVLAEGDPQNFEASKIYYYLRTGLPVVSEKPTPNNKVIEQSRLGYISPYDQPKKMASLIKKAVSRKWPKKKAINYILENHTWEKRVTIYDNIFKEYFFKER